MAMQFSDEEASLSIGSDHERHTPRGRWAVAGGIAAATGLLVLGCSAVAFHRQPSRTFRPVATSSIDKDVQLSGFGDFLEVMSTMNEQVHSVAEMTENVQTSYRAMKNVSKMVSGEGGKFSEIGEKLKKVLVEPGEFQEKLKKKFESLNATQKQKVKQRIFERFGISSLKDFKPKYNRHDGNPCADDEEVLGSLCYKKCSLLTGGQMPYRNSAFQCCEMPDCSGHNKVNWALCGGYTVGGDSNGNACPHQPGACLMTEEGYLGMCYKRCSLLSWNELKYRGGPNTCCKTKEAAGDMLAFMDALECQTDQKYYVGGGDGDKDPSTPDQPHPPIQALTETATTA